MIELLKFLAICLVVAWLIITTGLIISTIFRSKVYSYDLDTLMEDIRIIILWPIMLIWEILIKIFGGK